MLKKRRTQSIQNTIGNQEEELDNHHRPKLSEQELMQRMLAIVKRYNITVQKLNRLRFESLREDRKGTGTIPAHFFKSMQKRFNIGLASNDQRDLVEYFTQGVDHGSSNHGGVYFSIKQIDKLVDILSKKLYSMKLDEYKS